jgi:hypothetical protein
MVVVCQALHASVHLLPSLAHECSAWAWQGQPGTPAVWCYGIYECIAIINWVHSQMIQPSLLPRSQTAHWARFTWPSGGAKLVGFSCTVAVLAFEWLCSIADDPYRPA